MANQHELTNVIWQIAGLLRGVYQPQQYERVVLPMVVLRRFDCVLEATKPRVLAEFEKLKAKRLSDDAIDPLLNRVVARNAHFHNHSPLTLEKLKDDPDNIDRHLSSYIKGFSGNVRRIFQHFEFEADIKRMRDSHILYLVVARFCDIDLRPAKVDNIQMGAVFEQLIRRLSEYAHEAVGEHFTPRDALALMVHILFCGDDKLLAESGTVRKLLDPVCGAGGGLSMAQSYIRERHADVKLCVYGQDFNSRSYAVAASSLLIKGDMSGRIEFGDSLTDDRYSGERFDYLLANPPFGLEWKRQQRAVCYEHAKAGFDGRFGPGLPRVSDGALLFLLHMLSKFERVDLKGRTHGSRLVISFNASPMYAGGAGSGESEIRRWIIENDWLEAIIALPEQMFYNTAIATFIWVVTNRKDSKRKGKVQLVDAREWWTPMRRGIGSKRRQIGEDNLMRIIREFESFKETDASRIFDNADLGYTRVTVERPLRLSFQVDTDRKSRFLSACPYLLDDVQAIDKELGRARYLDWNDVAARVAELLKGRQSKWRVVEWKSFREIFCERDPGAEPVQADDGFEPDRDLRDFENVPLSRDIDEYFRCQVLPYASDAWLDRGKDKIGYEVSFNRSFPRFTPQRSLAEVDAELAKIEAEIVRLTENRQSLIEQAAAYRLRIGALTQDSRVPWLGRVPAHWRVMRLKFLVPRIEQGWSPQCESSPAEPGQWGVLKASCVNSGVFNPLENKALPAYLEPPLELEVRVGDVLMARASGSRELIGSVALVREKPVSRLLLSDKICRLQLDSSQCDTEFFVLAMGSYLVRSQILSGGAEGFTGHVAQSDIRELKVLVPPLEEQSAIARYLREETATMNALHGAASRLVALVQERRRSLVSEVTAGRLGQHKDKSRRARNNQ